MSDGTINPAALSIQGPVQPQYVPVREAARYPAQYRPDGSLIGHMLSAQLRLPARFGGRDDGPIITCPVLNDTGATIATMWESDWQQLNVNNVPITEYTDVSLADGSSANRRTVTYELRLISYASDASIFAISDWMVDKAIIMPDPTPDEDNDRLSGDAMRRQLWFLTTPLNGNNFLFVAASREAMARVINGGIQGLGPL